MIRRAQMGFALAATCTATCWLAFAGPDQSGPQVGNTPETVVPTTVPPATRTLPAASFPDGLVGTSSFDPTTVYSISQADGSATPVVTANGGASFTGAAFIGERLFGTDLFNYPGQVSSWDIGEIAKNGVITFLSTQGGSDNWHGLAGDQTRQVLYSMESFVGPLPLQVQRLDGTIVTVGPGTGIDGRGMAYDDRNGIIYATNSADQSLYRGSPVTGLFTLVGPLGTPIVDFRCGLAYAECSRTLYYVTGNVLYTMDVTSGATTPVGPLGVTEVVDGLTWKRSCDPCDDCPCPEDINRDGRVDTADLIRLLAAWGPCPDPRCDEGFVCGGSLVECGPGDPCFCLNEFDGGFFCGDLTISACDDLIDCPGGTGDCPIGFFCAVGSCCTGPECIPVCEPFPKPDAPPVPPGTQTFFGIAE